LELDALYKKITNLSTLVLAKKKKPKNLYAEVMSIWEGFLPTVLQHLNFPFLGFLMSLGKKVVRCYRLIFINLLFLTFLMRLWAICL
jgi:hypothetical protein